MKLKINFDVPSGVLNLSHEDSTILLGSCFSDELKPYLEQSGHNVSSNLFGTLFHPLAIKSVIDAALNERIEIDDYAQGEYYFSWDSAHSIYSDSMDDLEKRILNMRSELKDRLQEASALILTFGSAWGYKLKESNRIVANCHKAPSSMFNKELTSVEEIIEGWEQSVEQILIANPGIKIVFTVSPVRHTKDGVVENNRSKARLIEAVHSLVDQFSQVYYFPSYEIVMDELRDYRFYKEDLVHPSPMAVKYVWEHFEKFMFAPSTIALNDKVRSLKRSLGHRSLFPGSREDEARLKQLELEKSKLRQEYPEIFWK